MGTYSRRAIASVLTVAVTLMSNLHLHAAGFCAALFFVFVAGSTGAACASRTRPDLPSSDSWVEVMHLKPGVTLTVTQFDGSRTIGTLISVDAADILIAPTGKQSGTAEILPIQRNQIHMVELHLPASFLFGRVSALIGAVAGVIWIKLDPALEVSAAPSFDHYMPAGIAIGAATGAAAGLLVDRLRHRRSRIVYIAAVQDDATRRICAGRDLRRPGPCEQGS